MCVLPIPPPEPHSYVSSCQMECNNIELNCKFTCFWINHNNNNIFFRIDKWRYFYNTKNIFHFSFFFFFFYHSAGWGLKRIRLDWSFFFRGCEVGGRTAFAQVLPKINIVLLKDMCNIYFRCRWAILTVRLCTDIHLKRSYIFFYNFFLGGGFPQFRKRKKKRRKIRKVIRMIKSD